MNAISAGVTRSTVINFVSPLAEVNWGIWSLFVGATAFLALRLGCKLHRRTGLWWDDHILVASWVSDYFPSRHQPTYYTPPPLAVLGSADGSYQVVLLSANIFISVEFATGYVSKSWDDRMLILVTISSCLVTVGQTLSKMAFAVTLLRITESWQRWVIWFIITTLNLYLVVVVFANWVNDCGQGVYWWRLPSVCAPYDAIFGIKIGHNSKSLCLGPVLSAEDFPTLKVVRIANKQTPPPPLQSTTLS